MADIQALIEELKNLSIENVSDKELDELKEQIIKLLVDIQIQKEINAKINTPHVSTDDVQMTIMQKTNHVETSEKNTDQVNQSNELKENNEQTKHEYQNIIEEKISDEIIAIYTEKKDKEIKEDVVEKSKSNEYKEVQTKSSAEKITFSINDKFRIIRKLFNNHSDKYNAFLQQLNGFQNLNDSEKFIREFANKTNWEQECFEYKVLIKENQKRFNK